MKVVGKTLKIWSLVPLKNEPQNIFLSAGGLILEVGHMTWSGSSSACSAYYFLTTWLLGLANYLGNYCYFLTTWLLGLANYLGNYYYFLTTWLLGLTNYLGN